MAGDEARPAALYFSAVSPGLPLLIIASRKPVMDLSFTATSLLIFEQTLELG